MKVLRPENSAENIYEGREEHWPDGLWHGQVRGFTGGVTVLKHKSRFVIFDTNSILDISFGSDKVNVRRVAVTVDTRYA